MEVLTLLIQAGEMYEEIYEEAVEEQGIDNIEEVNEEEAKAVEASALYSLIDDYIRGTGGQEYSGSVIDLFYTKVAEEAELEGIYLKVNDKFINIENFDKIESERNIDKLPAEEWNKSNIDPEMLPLYFVFKDDFEFDLYNVGLIKFSRAYDFDAILEANGKIVYQGYRDGDFDTGYFSHGGEEYIITDGGEGDEFPFARFVATKEEIKRNSE